MDYQPRSPMPNIQREGTPTAPPLPPVPNGSITDHRFYPILGTVQRLKVCFTCSQPKAAHARFGIGVR